MTQEEFRNAMKIVQWKIGYDFKNPQLLIQAFTRSSYAKENPNFQDNEVLEFYGDSALNNFVTRHLYEKFGSLNHNQFYSAKDEGELSKIRADNIEKENLAHCIEILGFENYLLMGKGDIKNNVQESTSVKEDLFEAIIGAVAVDSKWNFKEIAGVCTSMLVMANYEDDYIALVEEWCNKHHATCHFSMPNGTGTSIVTPENYFDNSNPLHFQMNSSFLTGASIFPPMPTNIEQQRISLTIIFDNGKREHFEGIDNSFIGAKMSVTEQAYDYLILLDMREFVGDVNFETSIQQLQELYQNPNQYIDEPIYEFTEFYDANGNPGWKCVCKVYEIEVESFASSKKSAKKDAAFKMLIEILEYNENTGNNDLDYDFEEEDDDEL